MKNQENTVAIGSVGTTIGTLPTEINRFNLQSTSLKSATFENAEHETTVRVTHSKEGLHDRHRKYRLHFKDTDGNTLQQRTIRHGPYADRDIEDATDAIETQLWEWSRFSADVWTAVHNDIYALGEPNPHPPGERPGLPDNWYHTFNYRQTEIADSRDGGSPYSTYVPRSRYEFKGSNDDRQWYCGTLVATFNHEPPGDDEGEQGHVYGAYVYNTYNPLKPVDERINQYDTKEIIRDCVHRDEPHVAISTGQLASIITDAQTKLQANTEAIGDERRQQITAEAKKRLNKETGEYESQSRLAGF